MILPLQIHLQSDSTFARGDGVAGLVDVEVCYERATGLPYVRGRTFRGLLVEACAEMLFQEQQIDASGMPDWEKAAAFLFGSEGSTSISGGHLRPGTLRVPAVLRQAIWEALQTHQLKQEEVLSSLTTIRRQTAIDPGRGEAAPSTLRSSRLVVRKTLFETRLVIDALPEGGIRERALALTVASVYAIRRGGWRRNRGRGRLHVSLVEGDAAHPVDEAMQAYRTYFEAPVEEAV